MKITIKGHEIELIYCMRVMTKYEEETGHSVSYETLANSYTTIETLFYCAILGTLEHKKYRNKIDVTLTKEEFKDMLDEDDGFKLTREFSQWFIEHVNAQLQQITEEANKTDDKDGEEQESKN